MQRAMKEDSMIVRQADTGGRRNSAAVPIAMVVGGLLGVLFWALRKPRQADRPIIMTGGSFHVWGPGGPLEYHGRVGRQHIYRNGDATHLKKVVVRCRSDKYTYTDVTSLDIRYGTTPGDPNVILRGGILSIETDSAAEPLVDRGEGTVEDPDLERPVRANHQDWSEPGEITAIHVCCGPKGTIWVPTCEPGVRPRIKVRHT
jgi:hypothetical protein